MSLTYIVKPTLDSLAFPHTSDLIIHYTEYDTVLTFCATGRSVRDRIDARPFRPCTRGRASRRNEGASREHYALASTDDPTRLLSFIKFIP